MLLLATITTATTTFGGETNYIEGSLFLIHTKVVRQLDQQTQWRQLQEQQQQQEKRQWKKECARNSLFLSLNSQPPPAEVNNTQEQQHQQQSSAKSAADTLEVARFQS